MKINQLRQAWRQGLLSQGVVYLGLVTLFSLAIIGLASYAAWVEKQRDDERALIAAQNVAGLVEAHLAELVAKCDLSLRAVARYYHDQMADGRFDPARLDALLEELQSAQPELENLRVLDAQGIARFGRGVPRDNPVSFADRDYFIRARDDPAAGLIVSRLTFGKITRKWSIALSRRLSAPDGGFAGLVSAILTTDSFDKLFAGLDLGRRGMVTLRAADLSLIYRYPPPPDLDQRVGEQQVSPQVRDLVAARTAASHFFAMAPDGFQRAVAVRKVEDYPFYVITGVAAEDYLQGWRYDAAVLATFAAVIVLVAGLSTGGLLRAAHRLRASEAQFRALVEAGSDVVYRMNPDWTEMRYLAGGDFIADTDAPSSTWLQKYIPPDDQPQVMAAINQAIDARSVFQLEHRVLRADGSLGYTFSRVIPILDANGAITEWFGMASDITAEKQAAQELERMRLLMVEGERIAQMGCWEYVAATRQTIWSAGECRIYGVDPAGPSPDYGEMLHRCIHPADAERLDLTFRAALEAGAPFEMAHRIVRPDGSVRWVHDLAQPNYDAKGTLVRYIGTTLDITDRHQTEERLRQSEERLRLATDGAELGIWYWDMATDTLTWSDRCKVHLGLPPGQEPSFAHWRAAMHPDDRERIERLLAQAVANRSDYTAEYRVTWVDGSLHWISAPGRVYCAAKGDLSGMGGVTIDITARKATELNLRDSERRFRELFAYLPVAYQSLDIEGRWLDANLEMARLLGFASPEQMLGQDFIDFWDDSIRDQFDASYQQFKAHHSVEGELLLHRRDGTPVTVMIAGRIQRDAAGQFLCTHCVLVDISQRRALEQQLQDLNAALERKVVERTAELITTQAQLQETLQRVQGSEARFRTMFAEAPLGIALIDSHTGQIYAVNDRFAAIAGRTREEMASIDWMQITHPDDVQEDLDNMARLNAGEIAGFQMNKRYLKPDGTPVWISMTVAPVTLNTGERPRHLCMIEEITERIRLESALRAAKEAAEAANTAKSEFLSHMSHEIRTPLNGVLGLAQVLGREPLAPNQRDLVEHIQAAGQSLLAILNDILDFSKIEAGQLRVESRPFDLTGLLARIESVMGHTARAKGLALRIVGPDQPPGPLLGDGLRLEQVLVNLTGNAIKFTERGGVTVRVELRETGDATVRLHFEVRDTGIGIAAEALARLFAPFTQAEAGITRRFGGTGLGLSICKRLVELMGGTIGVESQVNQGSTFWFELSFPRAARDAPVATPFPAPERPAGPRLVGLRVLVVDDSALNREVVERALALEGASATPAADGQQAIEQLRARPEGFDAVLMDMRMPVMDGLTATRLIRGELGLTALPIIALTAGVLDDKQQAARAAGMNGLLTKPVDLEQLVARLRPWVQPQPGAARLPPVHPSPFPPAERPSGAAFPAIPGIDRARAAQTLGDDQALFLRLLDGLVTEFAGAVEQTRRDLVRGDRETAIHRLHTLRGNAGNLGALDLMRTAGELEEALMAGETGLEPGLATLAWQLEELIAASAPWRQGAAPAGASLAAGAPAVAVRAVDVATLHTQVQALAVMLENGHGKACQLSTEIAGLLAGTELEHAYAPIARAIDDLNFKVALDDLRALARQHNWSA